MSDYDRIKKIILYLDRNYDQQPSLEQISQQLGISPNYLHKLFSRWAGITPKDFLQCLTLSYARQRLLKKQSVLSVSLEAGLSGPGRLHDLTVALESASPGEIKSGGEGWVIQAGFAQSPFGICLIAHGHRGVCHLSFVEKANKSEGLSAIKDQWPRAKVNWNNAVAKRLSKEIFCPEGKRASGTPLRVLVKASLFQVRVWMALLQIPKGQVVSYQAIARAIGQAKASRAVGRCVADNVLGYIIPCHRVIRQTGVLGGYRWGSERKKAMLIWESKWA